MSTAGLAVPGTPIPSGALVSPGGGQGIQGAGGTVGPQGPTGPQGPQGPQGIPGTGTGDMLKSVYDTNTDNIIDHAALADAAPWTGITGKPSTFPPDSTAELVARKAVASGYASLDAGIKVPVVQLPVATATVAGAVPTPPNDATKFLAGNATFIQPSLNNLTSGAWTAFTATLVPGAGTITTQTSNSAYLLIGKTLFFNISVQATNIGSASGNVSISGLPVGPKRACAFYLRETSVNGLGYSFTVGASATSGQLQTASSNANPAWAANVNYIGFGVYETV